MTLQGRIYNPTTGQWTTSEFLVGNVAIDGPDIVDVDQLSITQLTGGNIVVGYARNNSEPGFKEPVYTILDENGNTVFAGAEVEGSDNETQFTVWESPPVITALPDGRWMATWINDSNSDDVNTMTLESRIFNADGTPATGDIRIGSTAVDYTDTFDLDHVSVAALPGGRVVIGYVETFATGATTYPTFSILDTTTGTVVASDINLATSPRHPGRPARAARGWALLRRREPPEGHEQHRQLLRRDGHDRVPHDADLPILVSCNSNVNRLVRLFRLQDRHRPGELRRHFGRHERA